MVNSTFKNRAGVSEKACDCIGRNIFGYEAFSAIFGHIGVDPHCALSSQPFTDLWGERLSGN
jgi:hypothetical protein